MLLFLILGCFGWCSVQAQNKAISKTKYVSQLLVVKLKPEYRNYFELGTQFVGVKDIERAFPNHAQSDDLDLKKVDLTLIYLVELERNTSMTQLKEEWKEGEVFEYLERKVIHEISFSPNDPEISKQDYLSQINAYNAWDVTKGSTSVKIGIVDSGTDMDHPDLQSEMYAHVSDPVNGLDDDNDGYVDNYWGWDFYDGDNDPQMGDNDHGVHVSGIASAATDNNEGVSSVGFNTQFVPIRVGNGTAILYGYEGIVYAADLGCDIVNCSWGSQGFSAYGQDVINYATFNKNTLVVAASGNNGLEVNFYPAAYENSLAVGSVNATDEVSSFTNYGYFVDILAPGQSIYSTVYEGGYNYNTGTSMAAPVVSGAAALVKSYYPQLTPMQLIQRLKTTSLNVDAVNPGFENKLGSGRLDVLSAVSGTITDPSIVFSEELITNNDDDVFKAGEDLSISGKFTNYLAPSAGVVVELMTNSPYITYTNTPFNIGAMGTFVQTNNFAQPFTFSIISNTPKNTIVTFEMSIDDGVNISKTFFEVLVNVDYLNLTINNLNTSLGSKGQFGYNTRDQSQGLGVRYNHEESQLFEGGLMIGITDVNTTRVVDRIRDNETEWEDDFKVVQSVEEVNPPNQGQYELIGAFSDANALTDSIGLTILQNGYGSTDLGHENYVVLTYTMINNSGTTLQNISVGLFADFDVASYDENQSFTDLQRYYTYTTGTEQGAYLFGVQLLTLGDFNSYCMDNLQGGAGGIDISTNYSTMDKFTTLTSNRYVAGFSSNEGNDVIQVTSLKNVSLGSGDSLTVAFAIIAAETKELLDAVADSAFYRYNQILPNTIHEIPENRIRIEVYPNPASDDLVMKIGDGQKNDTWSFLVRDVTGKLVYSNPKIISKEYIWDVSALVDGVYFVEVQSGERISTVKFIKN